MKKVTILYSGGLDSFIMRKYAEKENLDFNCVYYSHGVESEKTEISLLPKDVEVRVIDWYQKGGSPVAKKSDPAAGNIYIPGRNLLFATAAACQFLPDEIWLGATWDEVNDQATDKNLEFLEFANKSLTYTLSPFVNKVSVKFPFYEKKQTKTLALKYLLDNNLASEGEVVNLTSSCWHNIDKPCGKCKQCFKRVLSFYPVGLSSHDDVMSTLDANRHLVEFYLNHKTPNQDEYNVSLLIKSAIEKNPSLYFDEISSYISKYDKN